jgi:cysteine desulfurase
MNYVSTSIISPDDTLYADVNGSAQISTPVIQMVTDFLKRKICANPNANHLLGKTLLDDIENSRTVIANNLSTNADSIIFNSGASEGCSNIFHHFYETYKRDNPLILYSPIEHPCTLQNIQKYLKKGIEALALLHHKNGLVNLEVLEEILQMNQRRPILVCIMAVHNELGIIQPSGAINAIIKKYNGLFFCDMTQAIGKVKINISQSGVDYAIASGHKFGALPGVGFLYVKDIYSFLPLILGGGQESKIRGGTQNYLGILSLAVALTEKEKIINESYANGVSAREAFEKNLKEIISDIVIFGQEVERIPCVSFISLPRINSKKLQFFLNKNFIYLSTGSACSDKKSKLSNTVLSLGFNDEIAINT